MKLVIKRCVFFAAIALVLGACGAGGDSIAVTADGEGLTRSELLQVVEFRQGAALQPDTIAVDAGRVRQSAEDHIYGVVFSRFLESEGIVLAEPQRESLAGQISAAAGNVNPEFAFSTGFDFQVQLTWIQGLPLTTLFYANGEIPGILQNPPIVDSAEQLRIPEILQLPEVIEDPGLLEDPAFQEAMMSDPTMASFIQNGELRRRFDEIFDEHAVDIEVESRIGQWDTETFRVVAN